jgi:N-sulfoglucosamine sulfohydrolase
MINHYRANHPGPLFLFIACYCISASCGTTASDAKTANGESKPNLVFILADDCTFRDIGCYGGQAKTPNIDRLATEGMKFERCFQAAPMCSPTRHNLYTGLYPVRSGAYPNHTFAKPGTQSIVHYLKPLGYRVALSGKTHIASRKVFPFEYSGKKNPDLSAIEKLFKESKESNTPFCLFACSNEPHSPWDKGDASIYPPSKIKLPKYIGDTPKVREDFSHYLAEVSYFDSQVGQIDSLLQQYGLAKNTLLVVASEQGNGFPFAKWTCYGNGLQSALIARWPGKVKPQTVTKALVEYVDITPTFVAAAGGQPNDLLEGKSLLPLLTGKTNRHKDHVYGIMTTRGIINGTSVYPIRTVRDSRYRLIWNLNPTAKFTNACTKTQHFQSVVAAANAGDQHAQSVVQRYHFRPEFELYDCDSDPLELKNLAADTRYAKIKQRLKTKLDAWMKSQGDQGIPTEVEAILRLNKNSNKTRDQVFKEWQNKTPKKKTNRNSTPKNN